MSRRLPLGLPPIRTAGAKLAIALIAGSLLSTFVKELVLVPALVTQKFFVFELLTYVFTENSPMGVIFGALILWSIGGSLEQTWGPRKMVAFAITIPVLAGILTVALALLLPDQLMLVSFWGGTVMTSALWIAFGLMWGERQTGFWGMPVTGNVLALIGLGFIILNAAFGNVWIVLPSFLGAAMTFVYVRLGFPDQFFERFNSWRLRRQLDKRRQHLNVVSGDRRNMPNDSDRFIH